MSRVARVVVPGFPHHVTQRGNRGAEVFVTEDDRRFYLANLKKYAHKHGLRIWAYCLLTNHVHFVAVPKFDHSLARSFRDAHTVYAMRFNQVTRESGHVWQGRFFSCPLDEMHLWAAVRYVERNPVRTGLVDAAADYEWPSAAAHCGEKADPVLDDEFPPKGVIEDWCQWLMTEEDVATQALRQATHTGRPCGTPSFVAQLEVVLERTLRPCKRGPKPKGKVPIS